ncbi:MAG: S8 family peptidase [Crocinitomicaceae bacterium]
MIRPIVLFVFALLTSCSCTYAQPLISSNTKVVIAEIQEKMKTSQKDWMKRFPVFSIDGVQYVSFLACKYENIEFEAISSLGIQIGQQQGNIVSLRCPIHRLELLSKLKGFKSIEIAGKMNPNLSKVLYDTRVDSVHQGLGLPQAYTGKDVLIGITDWGFDYTHPMFYDTLLENTRILAAWDQFKTTGPAPDGFDYGTEYASPADLIAAGADTANIYSFATHGTHVAGIAGGSGAGTVHRGMAFESQFLFTTFLVDEAAVLDAWEWMYQKSLAEGKRLVVNMSWGLYNVGPLDGTSLLSQALDDYSALGVVFVTSAGNNGGVDFHIKRTFEDDTLLSRIQFYDGAVANLWGQSIHGWGETGKSFSGGFKVLNGSNVTLIESPWYNTLTTETYVDSFLIVPETTDTIFFNLSMEEVYPTNDRPEMRLRVKKGSPYYKIVLKAHAEEGVVHFWNLTELTTDVGNWGMPFQSLGAAYTAGDNQYGIGMPACTESAISVAAFSASFETDDGDVFGGGPASFTSYGPLITGDLKPDISAPGVAVASSISSYTDASYTEILSVPFEGRDYPFARFSGTSMSSPVVAGIAALMLEANPYLSPWQVKLIIIETAREDFYTGEIPDTGSTRWGWGKINAHAAVERAINTTGLVQVSKLIDWFVYPNPSVQNIAIKNLEGNVSAITIINLSGQIVKEVKTAENIDLTCLTAGTYLIKIVRNNRVEQQRFIIQ